MTSDLCTDDVVVQITSPQIISPDAVTIRSSAGGAGGARVQASSAAVELGRRLLLAARTGNTALVLDLMAKGAPFTTDWLGTSPLHLAASNAHVETCAVLLRAGVSRDSRTKVERTPLHLAAYAGHAHVAQLLLDHGAQVDCRDMLRMTPLHWAAERGHGAVAAALLRAGADAAAVSKFRKTPRQLAALRGRALVLALIDDAQRPTPTETMTEEIVEPQEFATIQRIPDIKITDSKIQDQTIKMEQSSETSESHNVRTTSGASEGAAAQLLRQHGITLLPTDDGSTVLSALQSGRTVVLSDAGKLMLKESSETTQPTTSTVSTKSAPGQQKGVVLTATPVKTPPKPGVKIFTINNKLLAIPKDNNKIPIKKIINPQDMQVKFVQLPADAKIVSPRKPVQLKPRGAGAGVSVPRPPVKIIMNKANYKKLVATGEAGAAGEEAEAERARLRAQLQAAQQAVAGLTAELSACRARLARYERPH